MVWGVGSIFSLGSRSRDFRFLRGEGTHAKDVAFGRTSITLYFGNIWG